MTQYYDLYPLPFIAWLIDSSWVMTDRESRQTLEHILIIRAGWALSSWWLFRYWSYASCWWHRHLKKYCFYPDWVPWGPHTVQLCYLGERKCDTFFGDRPLLWTLNLRSRPNFYLLTCQFWIKLAVWKFVEQSSWAFAFA